MAKRKPVPPIKHDDGRLPAPDAAYVWSLYQLKQGDGDESRLRTTAKLMRQYTRLEHELHIPDAYKAITKEVRTPYLRDTWHRTSTALNQRPYNIMIEPRDQRQDTERAAELGIRWDTALRDALDKEIGENAAVESTKALIRDGESVLKVVHRPDAWAAFPEREGSDSADDYTTKADNYKKGNPPPIAWRIVDRLSMLFGDGEFGDSWAIEYGEYPRKYLGREFDMKQIGSGLEERLVTPENMLGGEPKPEGYLQTAMGRAVKLEYFDRDWWHVVIDGSNAPGFPKPNPYAPRLPYFRAKGPDSESLLYSLMFLVPSLDELLTMKLNWSYLGAYPNPIVKALPQTIAGLDSGTGDAGAPPRLEWKPGKSMVLPPGWDMGFLTPPPIGKDLNDLVVILRDMIDVAGIPSVFRGAGGDNQAGYAINQLMAAASLSFKLAGESLSRQFERAYEFIHWLVPHVIDDCVYILSGPGKDQEGKQWLGLKPGGGVSATEAGVEELGPVSIEFRPMLPTDEQARAMIAMQLVNSPNQLISKEYARKHYLQVEDNANMADEIAVEKALDQPPLSDIWMQRALEDAGLAAPPPATPPASTPAPPPGAPPPGGPGLPSVPGVNMPMQPTPPGAPPIQAGNPGAFPGQPGTPTSTAGG